MPGYEKTIKYFRKTNLYQYLKDNGNIDRAIENAKKLRVLCKENPQDAHSYSEVYKVIELLKTIKKR